MKLSKKFTVRGKAEAVFEATRSFLPSLGFKEEKAERPKALTMKRGAGGVKAAFASKIEQVQTQLKVSFEQRGEEIEVTCNYDVKIPMPTAGEKAKLDAELEKVRAHLEGLTKELTSHRTRTGYEELDSALYGGLAEKLAVVLTSPSCDEKDLLVERFLERGLEEGEIVFHITSEATRYLPIQEEYSSTFHLFICNPQIEYLVPQERVGVWKIRSPDDINDINISLSSAFKTLIEAKDKKKRLVLGVLSDILLTSHAQTTRRWLIDIIPKLKAEGFTIMAVLQPQMHPKEQHQAIIDVFDGQIELTEKEIYGKLHIQARIRKMYGQKYQTHEIPIIKEKLLRRT